MPYGKMKKKMGCSGGGPNMYKLGSKENNSPANFSNKAMKYMEKMPAMYGKPKMDGDPVKEGKTTKKSTTPLGSLDKERYRKKWIASEQKLKKAEKNMDFVKDNPGQRELSPSKVKSNLKKAQTEELRYRELWTQSLNPKMYGKKKK